MRVSEYLRVIAAIDGVGYEEATKEQHLRNQKQPHPQFASVELLLRRVEMVSNVFRVLVTCGCNTV